MRDFVQHGLLPYESVPCGWACASLQWTPLDLPASLQFVGSCQQDYDSGTELAISYRLIRPLVFAAGVAQRCVMSGPRGFAV